MSYEYNITANNRQKKKEKSLQPPVLPSTNVVSTLDQYKQQTSQLPEQIQLIERLFTQTSMSQQEIQMKKLAHFYLQLNRSGTVEEEDRLRFGAHTLLSLLFDEKRRKGAEKKREEEEEQGRRNDLTEEIGTALKFFPNRQSYQNILAEELSPFFQKFVQDLNNGGMHSDIYILEQLSEVQGALTTIEDHIESILSFFSNRLSLLCENYKRDYGTRNVQDKIYETEETLKKFVVLQDRLKLVIVKQVHQCLETKREGHPVSVLTQVLSDMLSSDKWKREIVCASGLALSILINAMHVSGSPRDLAEQLIITFFPHIQIVSTSQEKQWTDRMREMKIEEQFEREYPDLSKLMMYRGILLAFPLAVLTCDIDRCGEKGTVLLDVLLPTISQLCHKFTERYTRTLALQCLHDCLIKMKEAVQEMSKGEWSQSQMYKTMEESMDLLFEDIMDFVWKNSEHKFESIVDQTKLIFKTSVEIYEMTSKVIPQKDSSFIRNLITKCLSLDWHRKSKYHLLLVLFHPLGAHSVLSMDPSFIDSLLMAMKDPVISSPATSMLETFLMSHKKECIERGEKVEESYKLIFPGLMRALNSMKVGYTFNRGLITHAIPAIFKIFPDSFQELISFITSHTEEYGGSRENSIKALLSVMKIGRKMKMIAGVSLCDVVRDEQYRVADIVSRAICSQSDDLCIDALELVCISSKDTEEPSQFECDMVLLFLKENLKTSRHGFRQEALTRLKKFFVRLRDCTKKIIKKDVKAAKKSFDMMNEIISLLVFSLYPGSPFSRTCTALQLYRFFVETWREISDASRGMMNLFHRDILFHCLWDHFDVCRTLSFEILSLFPLTNEPDREFYNVIDCALRLVQSPRARECDSGAQLFVLALKKYVLPFGYTFSFQEGQLKTIKIEDKDKALLSIFQEVLRLLEGHVGIASVDMQKACSDSPMHGYIITLRYLFGNTRIEDEKREENRLREWKDMMERILNVIQRVNEISLLVVADVAPEGYTSTGSYDCSTNPAYTGAIGQMITVASWLSVKEVALLLGTMVNRLPFPEKGSGEKNIISEGQIERIGKMFITVLSQSRHAGAIDKTATGYQVLCESLFHSKNEVLFNLPSLWLQNFLEMIRVTTATTRRSAGLPFGVCAILRAEILHQKSAKVLLPSAMEHLLRLATDRWEDDASIHDRHQRQVHAINILRHIFLDHDIASDVEQYLSPVIVMVMNGYHSPSWAVRNSCSMMFSVVVDRSIGSKKTREEHHQGERNGVTFREFFGRNPSLHPFLLDHLHICLPEEAKDSVQQTNVFAAVVLLSKLLPSSHENPNDPLGASPFIPIISRCSSIPDFMVRKMSAMALVPLVPSSDLPQFIDRLIKSIPEEGEGEKNYNKIHGSLSQIRYLMHGHISQSLLTTQLLSALSEIFNQFETRLWYLDAKKNPVRAISAELMIIIHSFLDRDHKIRKMATQICLEGLSHQGNEKEIYIMKSVSNEQSASLCMDSVEDTQIISLIVFLLQHSDYEVRNLALKRMKKMSDEQLREGRVQDCILQMMKSETHQSCRKKLYRLCRRIRIPLIPTSSRDASKDLADTWSLAMKHLNSPAKADILSFLGYCISTAFDEEGCRDALPRLAGEWIQLVEEYSTSDQLVDLRRAVGCSISSALRYHTRPDSVTQFRGVNPNVEPYIVRAWLVLLSLLEDEDDQVRDEAAEFVSLVQQRMSGDERSVLNVRPPQAQMMLMNLLSRHYPDSQIYRGYLTKDLTQPQDPAEVFRVLEDSRRLFEKEEDNNYEEAVIMIQLRLHHLHSLMNRDQSLENRVREMTEPFRANLKEMYTQLSMHKDAIRASAFWSNDVSFHPDFFLPLYRSAVALFTLNGVDKFRRNITPVDQTSSQGGRERFVLSSPFVSLDVVIQT
ncbi:hypothetical protein PROFUN_01053 [Planoprotostelium fungivorum]|uniref:DUF2428 domain-containing protein n=1 Tax=Planoprotostelium fungivorum TaxID=1890364 RepID=A0A2P6N4I9_9EUKA|nr:hypothetical protein PROFUN_01053 [Planoprotostelium fungivorum]